MSLSRKDAAMAAIIKFLAMSAVLAVLAPVLTITFLYYTGQKPIPFFSFLGASVICTALARSYK